MAVLLPEKLGDFCLDVLHLSSWSSMTAKSPAIALLFKALITSANFPSASLWFRGQPLL